ncbi:PREDICTED: neurotrypsin-like [Amphimedon queenslandica]|uniref:SRCR domain-containing protein n=1 Tax=Amphimedon queenslandica TaxID=400682 RepID=A0AAN0JGW7_AMPQE|nr:PREDICTED: neurotrypsin-like [Amphimedon queenslandica]|eukprot:XP_019856204.1 PREDICTED: neurotrypsin-like [Amphimedon queenslandica]
MAVMKMNCFLLFVAILLCIEVANGQANGVVRLNLNGSVDPSNTEGVIEVYYNNRWGSICYLDVFSMFYMYVPDVVCHQLGYTGGNIGSNSGVVNTSPVFGLVECSDSYLTLTQCSCNTDFSPNCTFADNLDITCYATRIWDNPYPGMVRLQGGNYTGQGIVQVYCNNEWAAVCNDGGLIEDETGWTICTQLGYNVYDVGTTSYTGKAWLDNVDCSSDDSDEDPPSCLSKCSGGKCPSSTFSCSTALTVTCSYDIRFDSGGIKDACKFAHGLSVGAIAGILSGCLVGFIILIILATLCICCCKDAALQPL